MEGESRRTGWYLVIFLVTPDLLGTSSMPQIVATNAGLRGCKFISVDREIGILQTPLVIFFQGYLLGLPLTCCELLSKYAKNVAPVVVPQLEIDLKTLFVASFLGSKIDSMACKLPSKSWSCGSLVLAASHIADQMPAPSPVDEVIAEKKKVLEETEDMSVEELEKLIEDCSSSMCFSQLVFCLGHLCNAALVIQKYVE